jgi:hypothetical protein
MPIVFLQPDRLFSPAAVLERQKGNIFEYSTLLCSFLIGSGYDAYVVLGYATREFCLFNQTRVVCPYLLDFTKVHVAVGLSLFISLIHKIILQSPATDSVRKCSFTILGFEFLFEIFSLKCHTFLLCSFLLYVIFVQYS